MLNRSVLSYVETGRSRYTPQVVTVTPTKEIDISNRTNVILDYETHAFKIDQPNEYIQYMIGLPEDAPFDYLGRVYILTINFNIFKSIIDPTKPKGKDVVSSNIAPFTLSYTFDTTWDEKIKPFTYQQPPIPYKNGTLYTLFNGTIPAPLNITYTIIMDTNDNNISILFNTAVNEYYVISCSVTIASVYPKVQKPGDFALDAKIYKGSGTYPFPDVEVKAIAEFTNTTLYG